MWHVTCVCISIYLCLSIHICIYIFIFIYILYRYDWDQKWWKCLLLLPNLLFSHHGTVASSTLRVLPKKVVRSQAIPPFFATGKKWKPIRSQCLKSPHVLRLWEKKHIYIHRKTPYFIGKTIWLFPAVFPLNWSIFSGSTPQTSMVPLAGAWASPGWAWTFAGPFLWAQVGEIMEDKPLVIQHLVGGLEHEFYFSIYWE